MSWARISTMRTARSFHFAYVMVRSSQHCGHDNVAFLKKVSFFLFTAWDPPPVFWITKLPDLLIFQQSSGNCACTGVSPHGRTIRCHDKHTLWKCLWHYAFKDQTSCIEQKAFAAKITLSAQSHVAVSASFSNFFWPQTCLLTIQTLPTIRNKKNGLHADYLNSS